MTSVIGERLAAARSLPLNAQLALATDGLADAHPELSSRPRARRRVQTGPVLTALAVGAVLVVAWPVGLAATVLGLLVALHLATTVHRLVLVHRAVADDPTIMVSDEEARAVPDAALPVYTVLVPAYREPQVIGSVVAAIAPLE